MFLENFNVRISKYSIFDSKLYADYEFRIKYRILLRVTGVNCIQIQILATKGVIAPVGLNELYQFSHGLNIKALR